MSTDEPVDSGRDVVRPYHIYAPSEAPKTPHARVGRHGREGRLGFNHEAVRRQFPTIPSMPVSVGMASAISRSLDGPALPLEWRAELGLQEHTGGVGGCSYRLLLLVRCFVPASSTVLQDWRTGDFEASWCTPATHAAILLPVGR